MDPWDAKIKRKLTSVKDTAAEVKQPEERAAAVIRAAKVEMAAVLNKMKKETTEEVEEKIATGKAKLKAELFAALEGGEAEGVICVGSSSLINSAKQLAWCQDFLPQTEISLDCS